MPTERDLERLAEIAKGIKQDDGFTAEERATLSRDSKVHLSVHVDGPKSDPDPAKKKHLLHHVAESPWSKIGAALLLGAGGGEGHRLLSPTGMVDHAEFGHYKEEVAREFGKADEKVQVTRESQSAALTECRNGLAEEKKAMYALGRYLYFVLPKTGVLVTLNEELQKPEPMDFHPPPIFGRSIDPDAAKPIQPAETFPLPFAPSK